MLHGRVMISWICFRICSVLAKEGWCLYDIYMCWVGGDKCLGAPTFSFF